MARKTLIYECHWPRCKGRVEKEVKVENGQLLTKGICIICPRCGNGLKTLSFIDTR